MISTLLKNQRKQTGSQIDPPDLDVVLLLSKRVTDMEDELKFAFQRIERLEKMIAKFNRHCETCEARKVQERSELDGYACVVTD